MKKAEEFKKKTNMDSGKEDENDINQVLLNSAMNSIQLFIYDDSNISSDVFIQSKERSRFYLPVTMQRLKTTTSGSHNSDYLGGQAVYHDHH